MKSKVYLMAGLLSWFLLTFGAQAMSINDLMLINSEAKEGKAGVFTLTNTDDITYFLKTSVSKVEVKDNKIIKTPYDRDNLEQWDIVPKPSKLVVEPRMMKELMIEEVCGDRCRSDYDRVYQINIIPVSYEVEGDTQNKVNMLFGFAPYYIIPAQKSRVRYHLDYDGKMLNVKNSGNTLINLVIDQCDTKTDEELKALHADKNKRCRVTYSVIAGRERQFEIPEELQAKQLTVVVLNHDESFREENTLKGTAS
ncbi:hypothetical protein J7Y46_004643 [Vibrio parahaemolyticus]|nr:hypothetical protein [Vibrio parahaemolyticus]